LVCINLGDTYDDRTSIDINVSNLAIDIFEEIGKEVETYVLNGNHDLSKKTNQGNTSLRTINYIPNIHVITEPVYLKLKYGEKKSMKMLAIPYLGNPESESEYLVKFGSTAKYALMHTELTSMRMDRGQMITCGVNPEIFKGRILAGHIHRRQESKKAIYVGSPYHTSRGDVGNEKGLYVLDVAANELTFTKNDYSPVFQDFTMAEFHAMTADERASRMDNNYNFINIEEDDLPMYQKTYDIYNLGAGTRSKTAKPVIKRHNQNIDVAEDAEYQEKSIHELINESILQLEVECDAKSRMIKYSDEYLKDAETQLLGD